jgi:hypothetical protein
MAQTKGSKTSGLIAALIAVAVVTIGGVTGVAFVSWPEGGQNQQSQADKQLEVLAKSAGMVSTKILLDYSDPMEQQFALEKAVKDLKEVFPEVAQVWVLNDKNVVIYATKPADIEKPYQPPAGIKIPDPAKFFTGQLSPEQKFVSAPLKLQDRLLGGLRLMVSQPQTKTSAGKKDQVVIVGAVALIVGLVMPVVLVSLMGGGGGRPAAPATDANTLRALKAEEASINARLESARKELAKAEELKSQQNFIESQIEAMRRLQIEEAQKLEALQKEAAEMVSQMEQRRSLTPQEMTANLSQQDQELMQKIESHRKEEMLLARKIEEIRKKVIDLDRRIEARRKEEAEIGVRIEAKKREEQALNQRMGG